MVFTEKRCNEKWLHLNNQASREVQRIRVNACNGSKDDKKNSYSLYFDLKKKKKKSHKTLNSVYFWYQLYVLEHLCC